MADLSEFEDRIKAALDRIREGTEALTLAEPSGSTEEVETLKAALEAEKQSRAALEAKLDAANAETTQLKGQVAELRDRTAGLRSKVEQMRQTLQTAREAGTDGITDPALVNRALETELDSLREIRDADRAELDALIASLAPLAKEERTDD